MGGLMSRNKGKQGEREVAALLKAVGFEARRGQQYEGSSDSPDVVSNIPDTYIEVKRKESFSLYPVLKQAQEEAPEGAKAVVFHRKNNEQWVVVMDASDYTVMEMEIRELRKREAIYKAEGAKR